MIALVDCNNFYASCERVFNARLRHQPVVILSNNDGCIIARSAEAKALGFKMGDPYFIVKPKIKQHNVQVFSSNYALYGDMSRRVTEVLRRYARDVEVYSIDESFLDLKGCYGVASRVDMGLPSGVAKNNCRVASGVAGGVALANYGLAIRQAVLSATGIPTSVGLAPTKALAKLANRLAKQSGEPVCTIKTNLDIKEALAQTNINDVWGIGGQYVKLLRSNGIATALDFVQLPDDFVKKHLTIQGVRLAHELRGLPCAELEVQPSPKKAICTARSFGQFTTNYGLVKEALSNYVANAAEKLRKQGCLAGALNVFVETNLHSKQDEQYFNSKTVKLPASTDDTAELIGVAHRVFDQLYKEGIRYAKCGVILKEFTPKQQFQETLFDDRNRPKHQGLMETMDKLNSRYGRNTLQLAAQGFNRKDWDMQRNMLSPKYTSNLDELLTIKV